MDGDVRDGERRVTSVELRGKQGGSNSHFLADGLLNGMTHSDGNLLIVTSGTLILSLIFFFLHYRSLRIDIAD